MTIRTRLTATLVLTAVTVLALSAIALISASDGRRLIHEPEEHFQALNDVHTLGRAVAAVIEDMHDVTLHRRADVDEALAAARTALVVLEEGAARERDPVDHELAADFRAAFTRIERESAGVVARVAAHDQDGADRALEALSERAYEGQFLAVLEHAIGHEDDALGETVDEGERAAGRTRAYALAVAAAALLVMVIAFVIVRAIQRRLTRLTGVVARMGDGALDARSTDVAADDELGDLGRTFNAMAGGLAATIATAAEKEALAQELALAARMQQAILPRRIAVPGLEIAAVMIAADQIGGDYYDVHPTDDGGGWIGIGDVSGHGFNAGVVMIMAQSTIASCIRALPAAGPAEILRIVNHVLYDNVRTRLGLREHMTLSLLRYHRDGRIVYAGAHQELLVRGRDGAVRDLVTVGPWLALVPDLQQHLVERELMLEAGESLVLFTDGLTEARTADGAELGLEGLTAAVAEAAGADGASGQCAAIVARVRAGVRGFEDDATLVVICRPDERAAAAAA